MTKLTERQDISGNVKTFKAYQQLGKLLEALEEKKLPAATVNRINLEAEELNAVSGNDKHFLKAVKEKENKILKLVEKEHKLVPKDYYKKLWMVVGMSVFGVPVGIAIGLSIGNIGMLGIGLPIGMAIGVAVGSAMDNKALNEGRQLDFQVK